MDDPSTEPEKLTREQLQRMLDRTSLATIVRELTVICSERANAPTGAGFKPTQKVREWAKG